MKSKAKKGTARRHDRVKESLYSSMHAVSENLNSMNPLLESALMLGKEIQIGSLPIASGIYFEDYISYCQIDQWLEVFPYLAFGLSLLGVLIFAGIFSLDFFQKKARNSLLNFSFYITCVICENLVMVPTNVSFLRSLWTLKHTLPFECASVLMVNTIVLMKILFLFDMSPKSKCFERKSQGRTNFNLYCAEIMAIGVSQVPHAGSLAIFLIIGGAAVLDIYRYQPYYYMPTNIMMTLGWNSLLLRTIGLFIKIKKAEFNTYIFVGILLIPLSYIVAKTIMNRSSFTINDPYSFELYLRRKLEDFEDLDKALNLFEQYKKHFLYFKTMLLWEFHLYFDRIGDSNMALNRLGALRSLDKDFLKCWNRSIRLKNDEKAKDMFSFQIEFFYLKCLKLINKEQQNDLIHKELDSIYVIQKYQKTEKKILKEILIAIRNLSDLSEENLGDTEKSTEIIRNSTLKMKKVVKSQLKSLSGSNEVIFLYNEFYSGFLKFQNTLIRQRFMTSTLSRIVENSWNNCIFVKDIDPEKFGHIMYANKATEELLGYSSTEITGMHFSELFPEPFDRIDNDFLRKFLLFQDNFSFSQAEGCYLSKSKHIVRVKVDAYLISFNLQPLSYWEIIPYSSSLFSILISQCLSIISWSIETERAIKVQKNVHIDTVFPEISNLLYKQSFELGKYYFMVEEIAIDNKTAYLLKVMKSKKDKYLSETVVKVLGTKKENPSTNENPDSDEKKADRIFTKNARLKKKLKKSTARLRFVIRFGLLVVVACFAIYMIIERSFINQISASKLLNNSGLLRYYTTYCATLTRTLQLIDSGYSFRHERDHYENALKESAINFEQVLNEVKDSLSILSMENSLKDIEVPVFQKLHKEITLSSTNLEQLLTNLYTKALQMVNHGNVHKDDQNFFYVYRNGASEIVDRLNNLVGTYMTNAIEHYDQIHRVNIYFSFLLTVPCFLLSVVALILLASIQRINNRSWNLLLTIKRSALKNLYSLADSRLEKHHSGDKNLTLHFQVHEKEVRPEVWTKPFLYLLIMNCLCIVSSVVLEYVFYSNIYYTMGISAEYYNYGGLRRMLPNLIYFWTRESYFLHEDGVSYFDIVDEFSFVQSPAEEVKIRVQMLKDLNKRIMFNSKYKINQEIEDLMLGSPCKILDMQNCTSSLISKGLHPALISFLNDIEGKLDDPGFEHIYRIEKQTDDIQYGYIKIIKMYENHEDDIFEENWELVTFYCAVFFVFFFLFYLFLIFFQSKIIFSRLVSRMLFIKILSSY